MAQTITEEFMERGEAMAAAGCSLEEADAFCRELTAGHYENFPVLSKLLPEPQRGDLCALYAFARLADDFADEARHGGERKTMLDLWRGRLGEAASGDHPHPTFKALGNVMKRCDIEPGVLSPLLDAFEQDTWMSRYETWGQLMNYCSRSADPVGRSVLRIFGHRDEALDAQSDAICTALQLANHWQDVGDDLGRDRIYIPREMMKRFGVTEEILFDRVATPGFEDMMREMARRTWELFHRGRPLAGQVGRPLDRWIRLVWLGGTAILRKVEQQQFDTLTRRPTLSRANKVMIALRGLVVHRLPKAPL